MHTASVTAAVIGAWVLAVGTLGHVSGMTSLFAWSALALLSLVPPVVMVLLWSVHSPSMSETIREALR